ncbi:MAG TPA: hypothetical protein ENN47_12705 [Mesotoga infera]|uniref:Uncharacterized protein n=1 Tax=Mesotoga infera TaxID=1236046 RepID=A0A7C1HB27_9BACT|nr:hypothetical protein [Mesotoga infera]
MKKLLLIVVVLGLAVAMFSEPLIVWPDKSHGKPLVAGLHAPVYGEAKLDVFGNIIGWTGPNLGLGWTWKTYFSPLELQKINFYYEIGTNIVILPYIGAGFDYALVLQNNQTLLVGAGVSASPLTVLGFFFKTPTAILSSVLSSVRLNIAVVF